MREKKGKTKDGRMKKKGKEELEVIKVIRKES
jgi:hypothetical protein